MPKGIGRQQSVGIAKETTRGTAVASATYWLSFSEASLEEKFENVTQDESFAVIEDSTAQYRVKNWAEGTIKMPLTDQSLPLILLALMGSNADTTHAGETAVFDHKATVGQSAQHQSLSFFINDALSGVDYVHALGVIHKLDLDVELKKFAEMTLSVKALKGVSQAASPSMVAENRFLPQYVTFKYAPTTAGIGAGVTETGNTTSSSASVTTLSGSGTAVLNVGMTVTGTGIPANTTIATIVSATAITLSQNATASNTGTSLTFTATPIKIKSLKLSIDGNIEDDDVLSSAAPNDFLNKSFKVEGQLTALWQSESDFKTVALATPNVSQALSIDLKNTDVKIGVVPSNPEVTIVLDQVYFTDFSRPFKVGDIVAQTVKFKATYSLANSEMIKATTTNTVASY
jgi:Phage tail tube protein